METFQLKELEELYSIYKFPVDAEIPLSIPKDGFLSITRTDEELSLGL